MTMRVLDVGQCSPDHAAITGLLQEHFDVTVDRAHLASDALDKLRKATYALVLVNRKLDADYSDGLEIVRSLKTDPALRSIPVMLVSNYKESQEQAMEVGAVYGFGKAELDSPHVLERLAAILG